MKKPTVKLSEPHSHKPTSAVSFSSAIHREKDVLIALSHPEDEPILEDPRTPKAKTPPIWLPQISVMTIQVLFVVGSVYLKSQTRYINSAKGEVFNPIVYAFGREALSGPILWAAAYFYSGMLVVDTVASYLFVCPQNVHERKRNYFSCCIYMNRKPSLLSLYHFHRHCCTIL